MRTTLIFGVVLGACALAAVGCNKEGGGAAPSGSASSTATSPSSSASAKTTASASAAPSATAAAPAGSAAMPPGAPTGDRPPPATGKDDKTLIADGQALAMAACSKEYTSFQPSDMKLYGNLVGATYREGSSSKKTVGGYTKFVAKKAVVRTVSNGETHVYIATDDSDPCALPEPNDIQPMQNKLLLSPKGALVMEVDFAGTGTGWYVGRSFQEAMADLMGGPKNWVGEHWMWKELDVKPGDKKKAQYSSTNPTGRSYLRVTKYEPGKTLEADIHACLGDKAAKDPSFLIGPIVATFCPGAQK